MRCAAGSNQRAIKHKQSEDFNCYCPATSSIHARLELPVGAQQGRALRSMSSSSPLSTPNHNCQSGSGVAGLLDYQLTAHTLKASTQAPALLHMCHIMMHHDTHTQQASTHMCYMSTGLAAHHDAPCNTNRHQRTCATHTTAINAHVPHEHRPQAAAAHVPHQRGTVLAASSRAINWAVHSLVVPPAPPGCMQRQPCFNLL